MDVEDETTTCRLDPSRIGIEIFGISHNIVTNEFNAFSSSCFCQQSIGTRINANHELSSESNIHYENMNRFRMGDGNSLMKEQDAALMEPTMELKVKLFDKWRRQHLQDYKKELRNIEEGVDFMSEQSKQEERPIQSKITDAEIALYDGPCSFQSSINVIQNDIVSNETAFFQVNLCSVSQQFVRWKTLLPRVRPYFAVKCQPDEKVISVLGKLGAGFDCASWNEIEKIQKCFDFTQKEMSENVIYANPFKFKNEIQLARKTGVTMTTFDTESELIKMSVEWPNAKLVLRISPERAYNVSCVLGNRFGALPHEVPVLLERAKNLNMDVIGLSFHVGSGCREMDAYPETVEYCSRIMEKARSIGFNMYLIDIGGGFPGISSIGDDPQRQEEFENMCRKLNVVLDKLFPEGCGFKIISEPGRYFVKGAFTLATKVIGKSQIHPIDCNKQTTKRFRYVINDGIYTSFNCILFDNDAYVKPLGFFKNDGSFLDFSLSPEKHVSTIYGPTCDKLDCVLKEFELPEMNMGNWIVWPNMGAYTSTASCTFNGIQKPPQFYFMCKEVAEKIDEQIL